MTDDTFWALIDESRRDFDAGRRDGNMDLQLRRLEQLLTALPTDAVRGYERIFNALLHRAYRWDLWDAAYIINSGCSDDGFTDFRSWLISMGRTAYETALADPDSLGAIAAAPGVEVCAFEEFGYMPQSILEQRGSAFEEDASESEHPAEPAGERTDKAALPKRFPKLWALFGTSNAR